MANPFDYLKELDAQTRERANRNSYTEGGRTYGQLTGHDLSTGKGRRAEADQQRIFSARERKVDRFQQQGQGALNETTRAAIAAGMPAFDQRLQGMREGHIRRGVNLGDIGTRDEGSLASAFQRNIANAISGLSMDQYNTSLDRLYGDLDRSQAAKNARSQARGGIWKTLGGLAGAGIGFLAGGPPGAAAGYQIGGG